VATVIPADVNRQPSMIYNQLGPKQTKIQANQAVKTGWYFSRMGLAFFFHIAGASNLYTITEVYGWQTKRGFDPTALVQSRWDKPNYNEQDFARMLKVLVTKLAQLDGTSDVSLLDSVLVSARQPPVWDQFNLQYSYLTAAMTPQDDLLWGDRPDRLETYTPSPERIFWRDQTGPAARLADLARGSSAVGAAGKPLSGLELLSQEWILPLDEQLAVATRELEAEQNRILDRLLAAVKLKRPELPPLSRTDPEVLLTALFAQLLDYYSLYWKQVRAEAAVAAQSDGFNPALIRATWGPNIQIPAKRDDGQPVDVMAAKEASMQEFDKEGPQFKKIREAMHGQLLRPGASPVNRNFLAYGPPGGGKTTVFARYERTERERERMMGGRRRGCSCRLAEGQLTTGPGDSLFP
jgi:hypothetical protein